MGRISETDAAFVHGLLSRGAVSESAALELYNACAHATALATERWDKGSVNGNEASQRRSNDEVVAPDGSTLRLYCSKINKYLEPLCLEIRFSAYFVDKAVYYSVVNKAGEPYAKLAARISQPYIALFNAVLQALLDKDDEDSFSAFTLSLNEVEKLGVALEGNLRLNPSGSRDAIHVLNHAGWLLVTDWSNGVPQEVTAGIRTVLEYPDFRTWNRDCMEAQLREKSKRRLEASTKTENLLNEAVKRERENDSNGSDSEESEEHRPKQSKQRINRSPKNSQNPETQRPPSQSQAPRRRLRNAE
mmetsp:Transcript_2927/g.5142  ORF Transcript_2927/g.5142 Transcript_2927/m.5142 type:complete len:303 (-) Transcript_2927:1352-2260(-)